MGGRAIVAGVASAFAAAAMAAEQAYADVGGFKFNPFSAGANAPSSSAAASLPQLPVPPPTSETGDAAGRVRNDQPRTTAAGFDPEALERGVRALREIGSSRDSRKVMSFSAFRSWK